MANNGRFQNYFNHIQSPSKLLCQYELCSQKKKIISEQKLSNLLRNITNSFISYYPDQCVVKTTSHQSITTVASVTRVQHLNCQLKLAVHSGPANIQEELGKKTETKKGIRLLMELEDYRKKKAYCRDWNFKKKGGGGRSAIMQEVGQHKFGGEGNAILFLLLNCNICIAWMRKSTEAEKRTWKRTAGKCSVETLSTGTKRWEILLQTAKIYLTPLLGERYEGNEWDRRIKTQNWCQRINSSKHLKERQTLTWQLPDKNDTLKKKKTKPAGMIYPRVQTVSSLTSSPIWHLLLNWREPAIHTKLETQRAGVVWVYLTSWTLGTTAQSNVINLISLGVEM